MNIEFENLYNINAVARIEAKTSDLELNTLGTQLAESLGIKKDKKGFYQTSYGKKTARGLYLSVLNILIDINKNN
jgi:hypothetical protein